MSNEHYIVEGWRPFNRFHQPIDIKTEGCPRQRFSVIAGPADAFIHEYLADRHLVKVVDSSAVDVIRFEQVSA